MNPLKKQALQAEYNQIISALYQTNFKKSRAAKLLGIDRKTLYNKMEAYQKAFPTPDLVPVEVTDPAPESSALHSQEIQQTIDRLIILGAGITTKSPAEL